MDEVLNNYDKKSGAIHRIGYFAFGDHKDVAKLRALKEKIKKTKKSELSVEEGYFLDKILLSSKPMGKGHDNHDTLFTSLINAVGVELFLAMIVLNEYDNFTFDNYRLLIEHNNPVSVASTINLFKQYPEIRKENEKLLSVEDPFTPIMKKKSYVDALNSLKNAALGTEANIELIARDPIRFDIVFKGYQALGIVMTQADLDMLGKHNEPGRMGLAILFLEEFLKINTDGSQPLKQCKYELIKEVSEHKNPDYLMFAYVMLSIYHPENLFLNENIRTMVKQSAMPVERACICILESDIHILNKVGDSPLGGVLRFFQYNPADRANELRKLKDELENEITNDLSAPKP